MKTRMKIKSLIVAVMLCFSCMFSACEFGINDLPSNLLFPDMEEGQDMISYLANKLVDQYKDTIIDMLKEGLKSELEGDNFDEIIEMIFDNDKFDELVDKVFDTNRDKIMGEVTDILKDTTNQDIFSDAEILALIEDNLIKNGKLKDLLVEDETFKSDIIDALATDKDFISDIVASEAFMDALMQNEDFKDYVSDMVEDMVDDYIADNYPWLAQN